MAGEIYSTFTFLGGAGFVYGSGGAAYYILGYGTLAYVLSYYLLPAVWRYATPRKLVSQADVFTRAYGSRALGVVVSVVAVAAMIPYLALQLKGLGIIVAADVLRHDLVDGGDLDRRAGAEGLRRRLGHPRLGLDGGGQGRADALDRRVHRALPADPLLRRDRRDVPRRSSQAKPGFAALSGDQLTPVWFSSTVLLTALGFYMWPHTFGSALSAKDERRLQAQRGLDAALPAADRVRVLRRLRGRAEGAEAAAPTGPTSRCSSVAKDAFPHWFVGLIGSAGVLCALVPGSMLLIASATTVAKNIVRG